MLLLARWIAKILAALNGEVSPKQIAAGFAFGAWIGLIPNALLSTAFLLIAFILNVNLAILFVATAIFKILGFLLDPVANQIGFALLAKTPGLKGFWTTLFNLPVVPYTKFNNTIVLGSVVLGFFLLVPLYFLAKRGVVAYRARYREKIMKMKIVQFIKASTVYKYYESYKTWTGG